MRGERGALALAAIFFLGGVGTSAAQERLPSVRVAGKTPCQVHPETAAGTAELWLIAREALEGSTRSEASAPWFLIQEWRRALDRSFRVRWERRDTSSVRTLHPFEKPLPGNLERDGYIQQRGWITYFYGPDAEHLLSEWFLKRHCFARVPGTGPTAGLLGLSFAPLPRTWVTDVAGVLWIDAAQRELRYVEYAWTNPPFEARAPGVGGRTDFVRLGSGGGGWIIQRWNIRMPRISVGLGGTLEGYDDEGGEVLALSAGKVRRR
ncbi:MAG TPA: hypothetical protein VGQ73_02120 [Gemmatimonadales bacterium]|nr:hypothetical protein [Gemmatimonadales bacterium]